MVPNDVRKRLLESIIQCSRSNTDLALSDYIFSNSLFHSIAAHRSEIVAYLAPTEAVDERVEYCIDSTKRYTMNVIRSSTSQLNMMNYSARNKETSSSKLVLHCN